MKSAETKERFIELRAEGRSYADIAAELNVSKPTLIAWAKDFAREIRNARSVRMDELFQKYAVSKTKRIEVFGRRLEALLEELERRDLTDVPTPALLKLALEYGNRLKEEEVPLSFQSEKEVLDLDFLDMRRPETWTI